MESQWYWRWKKCLNDEFETTASVLSADGSVATHYIFAVDICRDGNVLADRKTEDVFSVGQLECIANWEIKKGSNGEKRRRTWQYLETPGFFSEEKILSRCLDQEASGEWSWRPWRRTLRQGQLQQQQQERQERKRRWANWNHQRWRFWPSGRPDPGYSRPLLALTLVDCLWRVEDL